MGEGSGFPTLLDDIVFIRVVDMNPCTALNLFLPMEVLVSKTETPPKRGLDKNHQERPYQMQAKSETE